VLKRVGLAQGLNVKMQKSSRLSDIADCCLIGLWSESLQVSGLKARAHTVSMSCCPIEVSQFKESEVIPNNSSNDREQAGEAMRPLALESDKSKQQIEEHGSLELPANSLADIETELNERPRKCLDF